MTIVEKLCELSARGKKNDTAEVCVPNLDESGFEQMSIRRFDRTRAYVKIEDGCESKCAYCTIPASRGPIRSKSFSEVIDEVKTLTENGVREVVLTGIETGSYGRDLPEKESFASLLAAIDKIDGIGRVRTGSLDPTVIKPEFANTIGSLKSLCPHFHLSLQSGSDKTLKNMNRLYDTQLYTDMMNRLRELFDKPSFTTDIIVGFPQESEKDFLDSVAYMQKCRFMRVHCFSYSQRPGTKGAEMSGQLDNATKSERNRIMTYKSEQVRDSVYADYIGFEEEALLEQKTADGHFTAYTKRYIPVLVKDNGYKAGDIVKVRLTGINGGKMECEVIE